MSSRSDSSTSTSSTVSNTSTPNITKFNSYIAELVILAQQTLNSERTYRRHFSHVLLSDKYFKLQRRINNYLDKRLPYRDGSTEQIVEIGTLMGMIETGLGVGRTENRARWRTEVADENGVKRRACEEVEFMVFGLICEKEGKANVERRWRG